MDNIYINKYISNTAVFNSKFLLSSIYRCYTATHKALAYEVQQNKNSNNLIYHKTHEKLYAVLTYWESFVVSCNKKPSFLRLTWLTH